MHSFVVNANGTNFLVYGDETFFAKGQYDLAPGWDCLIANDTLQVWVWPDGSIGCFGSKDHIPSDVWDSDMSGFGSSDQILDAWSKLFPDRPYTLVNA